MYDVRQLVGFFNLPKIHESLYLLFLNYIKMCLVFFKGITYLFESFLVEIKIKLPYYVIKIENIFIYVLNPESSFDSHIQKLSHLFTKREYRSTWN